MGTLWRKERETYKGLLIRCAPGTHEAAAGLLALNGVAGVPAMDLAAGSGAFLARLREKGFSDLYAAEVDCSRFELPGVEPINVDLNTDFGSVIDAQLGGKRFGLISAIEIIEHLDSPRHFLKEVRNLLRDDGYALITTPNVANFTGRIRFLLDGELRQFRLSDYHFQRHISPLTDVQMRIMLKEVGFDLVQAITVGTFFGPVKRKVLWPAIFLARMMWGEIGDLDVRVYLAKKGEPAKKAGNGAVRTQMGD